MTLMTLVGSTIEDAAGGAINTIRPLTPTIRLHRTEGFMEPTYFCACGCGQLAGTYATSNSAEGIIAGQPKRFVHGHHSRMIQPRRVPSFDECYTVLPDGCWRWNVIHEGNDGYGRFRIKGHQHLAHRYSYERTYGDIPDGSHLDHICHDPKECAGGSSCPHRACVNPDHLAITTHASNCRRGALSKLDLAKARQIRQRFRNGELGVTLAHEFGVRPTTISMVVRNRTWREPGQ